MEMQNKQEADREKRGTYREKREQRMAEESTLRMEKMAEEARVREEEREERARVREEKRVEEARIREEERRVQAEEREHKMVTALKETRPMVESVKLPTMEKGSDIESFLELFETALTVAKILEDKWLPRLHAALDSDTKLLVKEVFINPDVTFDEAKLALTGQTQMSFSAASEAMMTLDEGKVTRMPIRQGAQRVANFFEEGMRAISHLGGDTPIWGGSHHALFHAVRGKDIPRPQGSE